MPPSMFAATEVVEEGTKRKEKGEDVTENNDYNYNMKKRKRKRKRKEKIKDEEKKSEKKRKEKNGDEEKKEKREEEEEKEKKRDGDMEEEAVQDWKVASPVGGPADDVVPARAARWIVLFLRGRCRSARSKRGGYTDEVLTDERALDVVRFGIGKKLLFCELKLVTDWIDYRLHLKRYGANNDEQRKAALRYVKPRGTSHRKKDYVRCLRRCFHSDDECLVPVADNDAIYALLDPGGRSMAGKLDGISSWEGKVTISEAAKAKAKAKANAEVKTLFPAEKEAMKENLPNSSPSSSSSSSSSARTRALDRNKVATATAATTVAKAAARETSSKSAPPPSSSKKFSSSSSSSNARTRALDRNEVATATAATTVAKAAARETSSKSVPLPSSPSSSSSSSSPSLSSWFARANVSNEKRMATKTAVKPKSVTLPLGCNSGLLSAHATIKSPSVSSSSSSSSSRARTCALDPEKVATATTATTVERATATRKSSISASPPSSSKSSSSLYLMSNALNTKRMATNTTVKPKAATFGSGLLSAHATITSSLAAEAALARARAISQPMAKVAATTAVTTTKKTSSSSIESGGASSVKRLPIFAPSSISVSTAKSQPSSARPLPIPAAGKSAPSFPSTNTTASSSSSLTPSPSPAMTAPPPSGALRPSAKSEVMAAAAEKRYLASFAAHAQFRPFLSPSMATKPTTQPQPQPPPPPPAATSARYGVANSFHMTSSPSPKPPPPPKPLPPSPPPMATAEDDDGGDMPRDQREMSMVEHMKNMGFADVREILGGLRHVESESASTGNDLPGMEEHLELAKQWIHKQREEAEEARMMDEARVISEECKEAEDQRQRQCAEEKMCGAPLEEIVGAIDDENDFDEGHCNQRSCKSKFFPRSELLRSPLVRGVFLSISSDADKSELLRFLTLEKDAYSWYGAVLPWCYFHYVSRNRFESFAEGGGDHGGSLGDLLRQQADELQRALFSLSEQQDNGLRTNVPRVFLHAQRDARSKGLPDSPGVSNGCADVHGDDEVVIVKTCAAGEN